MTAWGRTGRVVLRRNADDRFQGHVDHDVDVDGLFVGEICAWPAQFDGFAVHSEGLIACDNLPSLDAAVMWVLRRAAPDVWRAERGPVWRVGRERFRNLPEWHAEHPARGTRFIYPTWPEALEHASRPSGGLAS